jgi:hypothetical protein
VAGRSASYEPRRPGESLLYRIVQEHWETFRADAAKTRDGEGLPAFVDDEFQNFLRCGWLAGGFASHVVPTGARERLERLCRYVLRPAAVSERLRLCDDGHVLWRLPHPWRDGTTHVHFDPCDFLGRLAVLVPRPLSCRRGRRPRRGAASGPI